MTRAFLALAALSLLMSGGSAASAADKPVVLKPSSNWLVDWSDDSCILSRKFGADAPVLLSFRAYEPGYRFQVSMAGEPIWHFGKNRKLSIAYGDGDDLDVGLYVPARMEGFGAAFIFDGLIAYAASPRPDEDTAPPPPPVRYPDLELETRLQRISLSTSGAKLVLETGPMMKAFAALRQCTDDLVRGWGLDPAVQGQLTKQAWPLNQRSWGGAIQLISSTLPIPQGRGRAGVLVLVDKSGAPTKCRMHHIINNTKFLEGACRQVMKDARFSPALDKDGQPVDSFYTTAIFFKG